MPANRQPTQILPKQLRYAEEVAKAGSIQGAAKELSISASAIDRQILLLESDLGVPLFERQPRGMRLTAAGEIIVVLARRWRADVSRAWLEIRQLQGVEQGGRSWPQWTATSMGSCPFSSAAGPDSTPASGSKSTS